MSTFRAVVAGVADLAGARSLWEGTFGLEAVNEPGDPCRDLETRWGLEAGAVKEQLLLRTPGTKTGMLRLVQFAFPTQTVREGAAAFDLCPKNLDVYVQDMPARLPALKAAGHQFRNDDYSEVTAPNGVRFREIHMHGHDDINIVLLELLDEPMHFSPQGFAGIGALVTIVEDPKAEAANYERQFGFETVARHELGGPEIETMIGLPKGAVLDITILGEPGEHLGQLEVIAYLGAEGTDRYPRTVPPARGVLEIELDAEQAGHDTTPGGLRLNLG